MFENRAALQPGGRAGGGRGTGEPGGGAGAAAPAATWTLISYGGSLGKTEEAGAGCWRRRAWTARVIDLALAAADRRRDPLLTSGEEDEARGGVDEGWRTGSLAAEVITRIVEGAFYDLDAPPGRVCSEEVPIPYAKEAGAGGAAPGWRRFVSAVERLVRR